MQANCFVQTIKERCRVCYTCVRECPAKAIGISDGQADVIPERCIGCGICEMKCPVLGRPAIAVISLGETRSKDNRLLLG